MNRRRNRLRQRMWVRRQNGTAFVLGLFLAVLFRPGAEAAARPAAPPPVATAAFEAPPPAQRWDEDLDAHPPKGQFQRFFRMTATAYTPINTRMEGGRYTVTQRDGRSAHGVAVDPDLIPLGSRLWVPGYGHAIADDTGGRIQGHRIDVRVQDYDQMQVWGVRRVRVYVLEDP